MLIIGERINTSRKSIAEAAKKFDSDFIVAEARAQLGNFRDAFEKLSRSVCEASKEHLVSIEKAFQKPGEASRLGSSERAVRSPCLHSRIRGVPRSQNPESDASGQDVIMGSDKSAKLNTNTVRPS